MTAVKLLRTSICLRCIGAPIVENTSKSTHYALLKYIYLYLFIWMILSENDGLIKKMTAQSIYQCPIPLLFLMNQMFCILTQSLASIKNQINILQKINNKCNNSVRLLLDYNAACKHKQCNFPCFWVLAFWEKSEHTMLVLLEVSVWLLGCFSHQARLLQSESEHDCSRFSCSVGLV